MILLAGRHDARPARALAIERVVGAVDTRSEAQRLGESFGVERRIAALDRLGRLAMLTVCAGSRRDKLSPFRPHVGQSTEGAD